LDNLSVGPSAIYKYALPLANIAAVFSNSLGSAGLEGAADIGIIPKRLELARDY
jgi:hypothetical protein